jgi:hypothetical protein
VEPHQRRILGRIADEIASYRSGRQTIVMALNNTWGLFTAAEVRDMSTAETFMRLYYDLSSEDDLLQPWMHEGYGSQGRLDAKARALEAWALDVRDGELRGDIHER